MRSTSLTGQVPPLIAMTKRSPATPARRASAVSGAIRNIEVARRVDGRGFGLLQDRAGAALGRAAGEELGPPVDHAIQRAHLSLAIEGRYEQLAPAADRAHLRVEQRGAVEISTLDGGAQPGAAGGNSIEGPEVVHLAADVSPARAREIEEPGLIERERGRRRDAADTARGVRVESLSRHVDLRSEPLRQLQLGRCLER